MVVSEHKRSGMGGNQSKTQEKRRRKKELGDEGGKQLPAIFSAQKVKKQPKNSAQGNNQTKVSS